MPGDPSIALGIKTPEINPPDIIGGYQKAIALKNLMSEQALRQQQILQSQQQTARFQLEAEQARRDQGDQSTVQQMQGDPDFHTAYASGDSGAITKMLGGRVQAKTLDSLITSAQGTAKNADALEKDKREKFAELSGKVANVVSGLDPKDDAVAADQFNTSMKSLAGLYPDLKQPLPTNATPSNVREMAGQVSNVALSTKAVLDAAQGRAEKQAKIDKDAADAALALSHKKETDLDSSKKESHLPVDQSIDAATLADKGLLTPEQRAVENDRQTQQIFKGREVTTAEGRLRVEQADLALKQAKQHMELGPGAVESWVDAVNKNPDVVKEIPTALHTMVAKKFAETTGLPLPVPSSETNKTQETKARMALDNAAWIGNAVNDPEIQKSLGTVLGRVGKAEEDVGRTVRGLSPHAQEVAQELRTRMRYFVFQEGQAVLGGRLPQQLMKQLEASSADPHMTEPLLRGALKGAIGAASTSLENIDKERFGGHARSPALRGVPTRSFTDPKTGHKIVSDFNGNTFYDAQTGKEITQ